MLRIYFLTVVFEGRLVLGYILEDVFIFIFNYTENQFS